MSLRIFLLIVVSFELASAKKYEICEFAKEIFEKHNVTREDIYKHICIAAVSLDTESDGTLAGIYGIGKVWWCGEKEPSGGCNIKCTKLLDDDISDDVACFQKILSQQGLDAWDETESDCQDEYRHYVNQCLTLIDSLQHKNDTLGNETTTATTASSFLNSTTSKSSSDP